MSQKSASAPARERPVQQSAELSVRGILPPVLVLAAIVAVVLTAFAVAGEFVPGETSLAERWQDTPGGRFLEPVADFFAVAQYPLFAVAIGLAFWRRNYRLAVAGLLVALALGASPVLKELIARDRPITGELIIREPGDHFGYPSGHAMRSVLMHGYVAVVAVRYSRIGVSAAIVGVLVLATLLIWWDRVWDGAHWPSDIAGGASIAFLLLILALWAARPVHTWLVARLGDRLPP